MEKSSDLEVLKSQLEQAGAKLVGEGQRQATQNSYWVILPPFKSALAAEKTVAQLERRRIGDFYVVRTGEFTNAISLGVFSTKEAAQRRVGQLRSSGIKMPAPQIEALELPAKRYWLTYAAPQPGPEPRLPEAATRAEVACPATLPAGGAP